MSTATCQTIPGVLATIKSKETERVQLDLATSGRIAAAAAN